MRFMRVTLFCVSTIFGVSACTSSNNCRMIQAGTATGNVTPTQNLTADTDGGVCGYCAYGEATARWVAFDGGPYTSGSLTVTITCENGSSYVSYLNAQTLAGSIAVHPHLETVNCDGGTKLRYSAKLTSSTNIPNATVDIQCAAF